MTKTPPPFLSTYLECVWSKESLVLTNFYVASSVCSPSRAALLTGLYPVSTGIWPGVLWPNSVGGLSASYKTLASRLRVNTGYR